MRKNQTASDNTILIVTAFSKAPGGVTSYTKTLQRYCNSKGMPCQWISIEDFPNLRRYLIPVHAAGQILGALLGIDRGTMSWALKVIALVIGIRFALFWRKRNYANVVAMDVVASWAVKPDVLIVHGAMADEAARQLNSRSAFRFGCITEMQGYRVPRRIIAVDRALQIRISKFHRSHSVMIPNPVDLKQFAIRNRVMMKRRLGFSVRRRLVAFAGHFPEKYAECIPKWRSDVEKLGFNTVHLKGIPYELMPLYLNAADLVVSMSRVVAFMRVAIEALACGTPIISNNTPLASYCSPERLVEHIQRFRWPKSREALRRKALPFDANSVCNRVLAVIASGAQHDDND